MINVALLHTYQLTILALHLLFEGEETDFSGLGKMMLAGFVAAIGIALAVTFVRLRLRDKKPSAQFVSISDSQKKG